MLTRYGERPPAVGGLRLHDNDHCPSEVIDLLHTPRSLFVLGKQVEVNYSHAPGTVGVLIEDLTVENLRDLRDALTVLVDAAYEAVRRELELKS